MKIPVAQLETVKDTAALPKTSGLYFLYPKDCQDFEKPLYIGSATGSTGLHRRIHTQHVNDIYVETRIRHNSKTDAFQIAFNRVNKNGDQYIDKSSLRKAVGRIHQLPPGHETAAFIRDNFQFYILNPNNTDLFKQRAVDMLKTIIPNIECDAELEDWISKEVMKGAILAMENMLINHYKPFYNSQGKKDKKK